MSNTAIANGQIVGTHNFRVSEYERKRSALVAGCYRDDNAEKHPLALFAFFENGEWVCDGDVFRFHPEWAVDAALRTLAEHVAEQRCYL